jgi:uncharacterized Tic20 family protein
MIRFCCPTCHSVLQVADSAAGTKVLCGSCTQRLLVPPPAPPSPLNKTVLGEPLEAPVERLPVVGPTPRRTSQRQSVPLTPVPATDEYDPSPEERQAAAMIFIAALVGHFVGVGPFPGVICWLVRRGDSRFVDHHGKQFVNALLSIYAVGVMLLLIACGGMVVPRRLDADTSMQVFLVAALLLAFYALVQFVFMIVALFEAQRGGWYFIPTAIRFLRVGRWP